MYRWWAACFVVVLGCERVDKQPPVPAAVVFAYEGQAMFLGTDDVEQDPLKQYMGALHSLQAAFARAAPAKELPAGALGMLISYADKPAVRWPMQPIANLTPESFGTQKDYQGRVGAALADAVELGVDKLASVPAKRRILVVFGTGIDSDMKAASIRLHALKPQLEREHIKSYLLVYGSDGPFPVAVDFYDIEKTVSSIDGIARELHSIWSDASSR